LYVFGESYKNKEYGHAFANEPLPTIIANSGASRIFMPDGRVLEATPEVLARISGLPKEYKLPTEVTRARTIVGNGVPVKLTQGVIGGLLKENFDVHPTKFSKGDRDESIKGVVITPNGRYNERILSTEDYARVLSEIMTKYTNKIPKEGSIDLSDDTYAFVKDVDGNVRIVKTVSKESASYIDNNILGDDADDSQRGRSDNQETPADERSNEGSSKDTGSNDRQTRKHGETGELAGDNNGESDLRTDTSQSLRTRSLNNLYRKLFTDADMPREANDVKNYEDNFNRLYFEASRNPDFMKYNGDIADDINAILRATGRGGELYSKGDRTVEEVTKEIIKSNSLADGMEKLGQYLEETLADTPTPVEAPRDDKARVFSPKVTQSERITSAEAMQRMIDKYGKIKSGTDKGKARDMAFAKKVNDDTKVRTFTRTAAESDKLKDFQAERLRGEVLTNEVLSYVVISDTAAQNHARSKVQHKCNRFSEI